LRPLTKGPDAGKFSEKYKDDPNWWTHSLMCEGYGKDKHWVLLRLCTVIPLGVIRT
jgi:hypothetical protein